MIYGVLRAVRAWVLLLTGYVSLGAVLISVGQDLNGAAGASAGPRAVNAALGLAATVLAGVVLTWFASLTALALHRPQRMLRLGLPGLFARRAAALLLGLGLAGVVVPPSSYAAEQPALPAARQSADVTRRPAGWAPDRPVTADLSGWTPDRPAPPPSTSKGRIALVAAAPRTPAGVGPDDDMVVVRRGDTLWDITARHLGPGAGPAEIAAEWPRWYDANRAQIGADPALIVPGTRLRPPAHH